MSWDDKFDDDWNDDDEFDDQTDKTFDHFDAQDVREEEDDYRHEWGTR